MTEIKKLVIKATIESSEKSDDLNTQSKSTKNLNHVQFVPSYETLEERLSDLKVEITEMVERKIEQYHRKNNKH